MLSFVNFLFRGGIRKEAFRLLPDCTGFRFLHRNDVPENSMTGISWFIQKNLFFRKERDYELITGMARKRILT